MSNHQLNDYVWRRIVVWNVPYDAICFTWANYYFWQQVVVHLIPCKIHSIYPITFLNAVCLVSCSVPLLPRTAGMLQFIPINAFFPPRCELQKGVFTICSKGWLTVEPLTYWKSNPSLGEISWGKVTAIEGIWGSANRCLLMHMYKLH